MKSLSCSARWIVRVPLAALLVLIVAGCNALPSNRLHSTGRGDDCRRRHGCSWLASLPEPVGEASATPFIPPPAKFHPVPTRPVFEPVEVANEFGLSPTDEAPPDDVPGLLPPGAEEIKQDAPNGGVEVVSYGRASSRKRHQQASGGPGRPHGVSAVRVAPREPVTARVKSSGSPQVPTATIQLFGADDE